MTDQPSPELLAKARALLLNVETAQGRLDAHIIDLFMDNADTLGFSDDDCLAVGNVIRTERGLPPVAKWWVV